MTFGVPPRRPMRRHQPLTVTAAQRCCHYIPDSRWPNTAAPADRASPEVAARSRRQASGRPSLCQTPAGRWTDRPVLTSNGRQPVTARDGRGDAARRQTGLPNDRLVCVAAAVSAGLRLKWRHLSWIDSYMFDLEDEFATHNAENRFLLFPSLHMKCCPKIKPSNSTFPLDVSISKTIKVDNRT